MIKLKKVFKISVFITILIITVIALCLNVSCKKTELVKESSVSSEIVKGQKEEEIDKSKDKYFEEKESKIDEEETQATIEETSEETSESVELSKISEEVIQVEMKIESPSFKNNEVIPSKYTCDGEDINPPLIISGVPNNTASLVLIVDDPDAPGGTWVHWTLLNIDPKTTEIAEDSVPKGAIEAMTDFGSPGYGGPCPPSGTHRYFFKLYALDVVLSLNLSATAKDIYQAMEGHVTSSAELVGLYSSK